MHERKGYIFVVKCPDSTNILNIAATEQQINNKQKLECYCNAGGKIRLSPISNTANIYRANCSKCNMSQISSFIPGIFMQDSHNRPGQKQQENLHSMQTRKTCLNFGLVCIEEEKVVEIDPNQKPDTSSHCPRPHIVCPYSDNEGHILVTPIFQGGQQTRITKFECTHCGACSSTKRS